MRIIIPCAGTALRWGDYLGKPKHLITIEGEVLLKRTIRQFRHSGHIFVVGLDARYDLPDSTLYVPRLYSDNLDADKVLSSVDLWSKTDRTLLLFGDVWFSTDAVETIVSWPVHGVRFFGRENPSSITGSPWGELFGVSFWPDNHDSMNAHVAEALEAHRAGQTNRSSLWEIYRASQAIDLNTHQVDGGFTEINDWTDDFDFPIDYDKWISRRPVNCDAPVPPGLNDRGMV